MTKKWFALALSVLLLTGCTPADPEAVLGTGDSGTPAAPIGTFDESQDGYAYSNMQLGIPSGDFVWDGSKILFNKRGGGLYTFDPKTGEVLKFCQDATCDHQSGCAAAGVLGNLERYQNRIYAAGYNWDIYECIDGVFQPASDKRGVLHFFHADDALYTATQDRSLIRFSGDETPEIILEEYTGYWESIWGDTLYYQENSNLIRFSLKSADAQPELLLSDCQHLIDGEHIYYAPRETWYLYRCSMDGSNPELLLEEPVLTTRCGFDNEYFYYLLHTDFSGNPHPSGEKQIDLWRFPKADPTAKEYLCTIPVSDGSVYTVPGYDRIFIATYDAPSEESQPTQGLYTIKTDGTDLREHPLPEH